MLTNIFGKFESSGMKVHQYKLSFGSLAAVFSGVETISIGWNGVWKETESHLLGMRNE